MGFVIEFKKLLKEGTRVKVNIINIRVKTIITNENIILVGFLSIRDRKENIDRDKLKLLINEEEFDIKFPFKRIKVIRGLAILSNFYIIKIPIEKLLTGNIHNKPFFIYKKDGEIVLKRSLRYNLFSNVNNYYTSRAKILKDKNTSVYVRQSAKNRVMITVRNINKTDYPKEQIKINLAFLFSKIIPKNKIIMYEKNSSRYEESASVLYEKLIDLGYKNIYYIINKDNEKIKNINDKYKKHLVYKYSFRHYLYFFIAKTLIGTESPGHAIELRTANRHSTKRIYSNKFNDIVYISARDALDGLVNKDNDLIDKSNINKLYKSIERNFKIVCEKSQINSKYKNLSIMKNKVLDKIYSYKRNLYKDISLYNEIGFELYKTCDEIYLYTLNYINEFKKKKIYTKDDLYSLKKLIENLEIQCSKEIEKKYNILIKKADFINSTKNNINTKVYFSKSKYLIINYNNFTKVKRNNQLSNLINQFTKTKSEKVLNDEIALSNHIYKNITYLEDEIITTLKDKLDYIKDNVNEVKQITFKNKYLDYNLIKEHISYLNNIENILINLR